MSWQNLENENPTLAETGRQWLNGRTSYFATTRTNDTPRIHPVTPIVGSGKLFVFMKLTSPKGKNLVRNGRYTSI